MNRAIFLFVTAFCFSHNCTYCQFPLPQLQAGVYVNDSVNTVYYCFVGYCDSLNTYDVIFSVDTNLTPLVSGVELKYVVSGLPLPPDSVYTSQTGTLHNGDTLPFSSANNSFYTFYSSGAACITLNLRVVGTPSSPFEIYPCSLITVCTLSDCFNSCASFGFGAPCTVDNFNGIYETNDELIFSIQPNPVENILTVKSNSQASTIEIFNLLGSTLYQQRLNADENKINLEFLASGIYFLRYYASGRERMIKFVKK